MRKKVRKRSSKGKSYGPSVVWGYLSAFVIGPAAVISLITRQSAYDLSLPWVIGPAAWLATSIGTFSFLRALITRTGLTWGSLLSCAALAAFTVTGTVYLWAPPMGPLVTLLLAQLSSTIIFILLAVLLRKIQIGMDPVSNVELGPLPDLEALGKALLGGMAMLVFWNGLTVIFYYTRCADLRCMNGEMIMGVRGPFSNVYYACYFGILAFAVPMWATFRMLRDWASRPEEKEEKPPQ